METVINAVLAEMQADLKPHQLKRLADTLRRALGPKQPDSGQDLLALFLTAKEVEGCSPKTIEYYEATLRHMDKALAKPYTQIESDDLRHYLNDYETSRGSSKVTIDNIRRIIPASSRGSKMRTTSSKVLSDAFIVSRQLKSPKRYSATRSWRPCATPAIPSATSP